MFERDQGRGGYRLAIGGVHGTHLSASATDPITGNSVPVQIISTTGSTAVVQVALTDYPRIIVLQDS